MLRDLEALEGYCLLPSDAEFPALLREIPDPPALLFAQGNLALLQRPAVAIVGSRDHSAYGRCVCRTLGAAAAAAGVVVVSGMARGLDAVAHEAALDAGGDTIGVLGNGLGVVYPAANRSLYHRVRQEGVLLTEFPPGERPNVHTFPRRNRLISALCRVTVVVEAAVGSGALITADAALDQGREVMAVPGNITSATSDGTNRLIRDGAAPLLQVDDVMQHFADVRAGGAEKVERRNGGTAEGGGSAASPRTLDPRSLELLRPEARAVVAALGDASVHLDDLAGRLALPIGSLLATLCELELEGRVLQGAGCTFRLSGG